MTGPRPVVFDCDGVLVDSEALAWRAWREALAPYGLEVSDAEMVALTGHTDREAHGHFARRGAIPSYEPFSAELAERTYRLFDRHLEAFEDAADTLERLHDSGRPLAVASNSPAERLERSLAATGLGAYFTVAVGVDQVTAGKPAADLYLAAASRLGAVPADCFAVEDSPAGVAAARAAGMTVVAVDRGWYDRAQLAEADLIVPRLTPAPFL